MIDHIGHFNERELCIAGSGIDSENEKLVVEIC